jgi:hypothetical protein
VVVASNFIYASFMKSACIDMAKAVACGTSGPYGHDVPILMLIKATGGLKSEFFN